MSARKKRRTSPPSGQFDLVVVGCGGGHDETNLSGYLCKPRDQSWDAGILGLEAGSGYGALKRLLGTTHPRLFSSLFLPKSKPSLSAADRAHIVYTHLRAFLLTHAHLDHAASLVISAGSLPGPTKYVLGAQGVLDDLNRCIFTPGRCWPNIVGWDGNTTGGKLKALPVAPSNGIGDKDEEYTDLGVGIESVQVRLVPLAHGSCSGGSQPHPDDTHHANEHQRHQQGEEGVYRSSAFFVRHKPSRHEFLFFGDVEADNLAPPLPSPHSTPALTPASTLDSLPACEPTTRPLLFPVWQHAAHLFTTSRLHTLLLECSWPAGRPTAQLFGHLGVEQVRREMRTLAGEVLRARKATTDNVGAGTVGIMTESMDEVLNPIAIKPPANRVSTRPRSRRTQTENLPRITRGSKRKATHLSLNPIPVSRGTTPLSDTNANLDPLAGALTGLRVIIIHCKEPAPGFDLAGAPTIADYIVRQLRQGVPGEDGLSPDELGVEYVAAHQGDEFGELCFSLSLIRSDAGWDRTSICVDHGRRGAAHSARGQDADWKLLPPAFLVL